MTLEEAKAEIDQLCDTYVQGMKDVAAKFAADGSALSAKLDASGLDPDSVSVLFYVRTARMSRELQEIEKAAA